MKKVFPIIVACFSILLGSCASTPAAAPQASSSAPPLAASAVPSSASGNVKDAVQTMRELRDAARAAFDANHPVEALRHLVGLIAVDGEAAPEKDSGRGAERAELIRKADAELTAIGARFTMEPTDEWMSGSKQLAGNVRDLSKGAGLKPAVRVVINYDYGKAVVADAPVRFAFVDGVGDISVSGTTDSYGVASATVRGLAHADKPVVIRAVLAVSNRGKTKVFSEVFRDFSYLPSSRAARVMALERVVAADKKVKTVADRSPLMDAVTRGLSGSGLDLVPSDGALDPAAFMSALNGDPAAVSKALALGGTPASFLAIAVADCDEPRQMVLQGKTYEIYTTNVRANVRLLRSDGSVVDSRPMVSARGQGGTPDQAVQAAFKAVRDGVEKDLVGASSTIKSSLD
ncbi:MAG: hypothetical protein WCT14_03360 [Treponemataceae bacterium]